MAEITPRLFTSQRLVIFVLNLKSRTVAKNGVPVDLTQVEYQIMEFVFA